MNYCIVVGMLVAVMLGGCSSDSEDTEATAEPLAVEDSAFGDMVGTMDKARSVEDTLDAHKQEMDRQLRINEGEAAN